MTEIMAEQMSLFDLDIWSSKMSADYCPQTAEQISRQSLRKSSGSSAQKPLMCLCLRSGGGADNSMMSWVDSASLGQPTTASIGVYRKEDEGYVSLPTSMVLPQGRFSLTLNMSELPREVTSSRPQDILETDADKKYSLSVKACLGILNRASRKGKPLPEELKKALLRQAGLEETADTETVKQAYTLKVRGGRV